MNVTAVPTEQITQLDGVPVRVWRATTEDGIPFLMFVHRVAVPADQDAAAFDKALKAMLPPLPAPTAVTISVRVSPN